MTDFPGWIYEPGTGRRKWADEHGNTVAREGCSRCDCGCKYWENDRCIDCGAKYEPRFDDD